MTGAGGYIGSAIVKRLVEEDKVDCVHAVVRGDITATRYDALREMKSAGSTSLEIFSADLSVPGSYDDAVKGCRVVIHVATPTTMKVPMYAWNKEKKLWGEIVRPAVEGVENVVGAIEKSQTVETLVLTSSMSAVQGDGWERGKHHIYTEEDWNEVDHNSPKNNAYACSKVRSEKRAWELFEAAQKESTGVWKKLVVLCPGLVLGKPCMSVQSELIQFMVELVKGNVGPVMPNYHFSMVHLDDVVNAHIAAATTDTCQGRYLLAQGGCSYGMTDVLVLLNATSSFQSYSFPHKSAPKWILWLLSLVLGKIHWPLVRAYLDKPSRFDATRICKDVPMLKQYRDPLDGFAEMLRYIIDSSPNATS